MEKTFIHSNYNSHRFPKRSNKPQLNINEKSSKHCTIKIINSKKNYQHNGVHREKHLHHLAESAIDFPQHFWRSAHVPQPYTHEINLHNASTGPVRRNLSYRKGGRAVRVFIWSRQTQTRMITGWNKEQEKNKTLVNISTIDPLCKFYSGKFWCG